MNNQQYDNKFSDGVLIIVGTLVRTVERALVTFFDGLRSATEHGSPSLIGFVAAALPVIAPLPIAAMTANSLRALQHWDMWQAVAMAATIEGAGFVLWVSLVETLMADGWKGTVMQFFFSAAVTGYETLLILLNAILSKGDVNSWVLLLECLFPALCAIAYGYRNHDHKKVLEREHAEQLQLAEKIRQERREDRRQSQELKLRYAADVKTEQLERPFRGKRS
jgi:hypothetical protein